MVSRLSPPQTTATLSAACGSAPVEILVGILVGQVPKSAIGTDAFQGADMTTVARPVTKSAELIDRIDQLVARIPRDLGLGGQWQTGHRIP